MSLLLLDGNYQWLEESNYLWILDAGHGGMKDGQYTTAPAKMHEFPTFTIYEGVINRAITSLVEKALHTLRIDYAVVAHSIEDTPLSIRVSKADAVYSKDKRAIYLSIHSNASGGSGFEIFTSPGQTKSDKVANIFYSVYEKSFPDFKMRSDKADGDADKEADFYVLRKTDCPSILVENLFLDNQKEAEYLMSKEGQKAIADCIVAAIKETERLKPF
jgi:N-acetylmuramoyl-L-alanine amidase